jgi:nitrogen regulatory protein P-II 1
MKKIECVVRSEKLKDVTEALKKSGIGGMTVSEVRGFGIETKRPESFLFVHKTKLEIYASDEQVKKIICAILMHCSSGKAGDGKVAVLPMDDCVRVRTGERKNKAIKKTGEQPENV